MKFNRILFLLALTLLAACEKTADQGGAYQPPLGNVSLQVTLPSLAKAGLNEGTPVWEAGDSISVWDGYGVRVFKTSTGGSQTAEFTGDAADAEKYYVVYPAGNCHSYAAGKADILIPEVQQVTPGGLAKGSFVCYGISVGGKSTLKATTTVVEVDVAPGNKAVSEIVLEGSLSDALSGYLIITSEPEGVKPVFIGKKNRVTLVPAEGDDFIAPGKYCVPVIPSELSSGLDITFNSAFFASKTFHSDALNGKLSVGSAVAAGSFDPLGSLVEEEADDESADPTSKYGLDFSSLVAERHPRLIVNAEDFVRLKKIVDDPANADLPIVKLHKAARTYADNCLAKTDDIPIPDGAKSDVLNDVARASVQRIVSAAYAWCLTGLEKYLTKAKADLARICSFSTWYPVSYLSTAELQFAAAIGYDWLYYDLTKDERAAAHKALRDLGLKSVSADHISQHNNWNQVCNAGLLCSALAIYEKDKSIAAQHIDKCIEVNIPALETIYGQDGSYPEGYGYWDYGTEYQIILTQALLTAFGNAAGIENQKGFCNTGEYMLYMSDAFGTFDYSDGGRSSASIRGPQWWFAARQNRPDLLYNELPLLEKGSYGSGSRFAPLYPLYLIKYPETDLSTASKPSKDIWSGNGTVPMVMVHTGWNDNSSDSYLAAKGGRADENHGHMDAGSFVFDYNGVRWVDEILLTGGYAPYENALSAEGKDFWSGSQSSWRWDVFVINNLAHPTLSFANNDGSVSGKVHDSDHCASGKATLVATVDTETEKGASFDMSPVFKGQVAAAKRTVVLKNASEAVITDEITALDSQDAELIWTAPTKIPFTPDDDCIELIYGKKEMYLYVTSSLETVKPVFQDFGFSRPVGKWGWVARDWDQTISAYHIMGYTATIPQGSSVKLVTTISASAPGQSNAGGETERPEM